MELEYSTQVDMDTLIMIFNISELDSPRPSPSLDESE